jgi:hypothetical protein
VKIHPFTRSPVHPLTRSPAHPLIDEVLDMNEIWPWLSLALMGAYHGINPAMGWLFAVALGLQERRRSAVLQALSPIALGHAAAIAVAVVAVGMAQMLIASERLRLACAGLLIVFGVYKLIKRNAHPRWVGMRVSFRDLIVWSLLMSTAHGAGLMLVPVLLRFPAAAQAQTLGAGPLTASPAALSIGDGLLVVGVHTAAMLLIMGAIALVVFEKLGLAVLRRAWINLDLIWAAALVVAGLITLAIS